MVKCEKLKALVPESTCVARQKIIHKERPWRDDSGVIFSCSGCKIGEKLWRDDKKMGSLKEKTCATCGDKHPANLNYFDPAPRAADKLTNECKWCRGTTDPVSVKKAKADTMEKTDMAPAPKKNCAPKQARKILNINIEGAPGLWEALVNEANANLRTPLAQALWILREKLI